ncbi:MAG: WYL domain-containing protein [Chloroflexaceae bacterium]|jgi:predicted DNA-binding transcriptional regulator YafY|nr:WYL domain-containing protein [Chloroflexaceae bacterium]
MEAQGKRPQRGGGKKRSSTYTFQRRLFLVRRLVRGSASADSLITEARRTFNHLIADDIYPGDDRAALRSDLRWLRNEYGCVIDLNDAGCYTLHELGHLALLDLPDEDLETLAFLLANFSETPLPNAGAVDSLLDRMLALLPPERRACVPRPARDVRLELPAPSAATASHTLHVLKRALRRQQVRFVYRSSFSESMMVVQHHVEPWELIFRDGHTYLDAFCLDCGNPEGNRRWRLYRLDRMVEGSVTALPNTLHLEPPPRPLHMLRYRLAPAVARQQDVAIWFSGAQIEFDASGAAMVTGQVHDLWQARQVLLRYREHCQVLEPPELVAMMRESVERMATLYPNDEEMAG